ncbi:DNA polymerase III subunit alpha [Candidatus Ecksteinia adelgidicola]|nr:DNA polymerase III subunit alpha [Candidatus Ecksteinia adelgidicola]
MPKPRFIHLRIHSDYSMIDGLSKVKSLVKRAANLGMPALAITDFTNLFGLVKFYNYSYDQGIKPIIGSDFYLQNNIVGVKLGHITILAMNNKGYQNLILLISHAYQRGYDSHGPFINQECLVKYREGLLIISGACHGDIGQLLLCKNKSKINQCLDFYKKYFPNAYYLELIRTGRLNEERYLHSAVELAIEHNLPVVATNDVRFLSKNDFDAHEIREAIHKGITLNDPKRIKKYSSEQYMRSEEEMCKLFSDIPEALINTIEIAKRCNVFIRLGEYFLPQFPTGNMNTENFLILKSKEGLNKRLLFLFPDHKIRHKNNKKYNDRLNLELKVINKMGFSGYFLIVMEFIHWSKKNKIPVGPGRGSGAGSLVAYALNITDIDPLEFDLLFERFLNPERISMPDFDIDFCMEKRDLVIDHVSEIYGRESVSQIITFGTMTAKAVIRDVGRALGYPYSFVDRIAKLIPIDPGITLKKAFFSESKLLEMYKTDEEVKILIDMAKKLEGVIRNAGKHAGGVVISPTKITDFSPLYYDQEGHYPVTQFDKNDIEHVGLVKFDFLGLRTLTIIDWTIRMINEKNVKIGALPIDITTIPLNDKESFNILKRAETTAVFQLESRGMKDLIKRLKPDCFEDIIALVALFRPGPLQSGMVDNFINRKHGREAISYPDFYCQHESLKPVLESTYGIILYQEQVMKIAQILAGYTLGNADILRRAMSKKDPIEMKKQRSIFENGSKLQGLNSEMSVKIFNLVEKFAGYGFNKSHSAAYALVSYQTLWLKAHYPVEFMAAVMTADMDNTNKVVGLIDECWRMGLKILPPDINSGQYYFHVNDNEEIVYGIGAIKGLGESLIKSIIKIRNSNTQAYFKDLFDLCSRSNIRKLNRRVLEKLIMSGALDQLGPHRAALMHTLDDALKSADQYTRNLAVGQVDMFGLIKKDSDQIDKINANIPKWKEQVVLEGERETLGLYLTGHPITQYLKEIQFYSSGQRLKDIQSVDRGRIVTIVGLVLNVRVIMTKLNNPIGICTLDDRSGHLEVILFTEVLKTYKKFLQKDRILIVNGQVHLNHFNKKLKIIARKIMDISDARKKYVRRISILITNTQNNHQFFNSFKKLLKLHELGTVPVNIYYQQKNIRTTLCYGETWHVTLNDSLLNDLKMLVGSNQVKLEFN